MITQMKIKIKVRNSFKIKKKKKKNNKKKKKKKIKKKKKKKENNQKDIKKKGDCLKGVTLLNKQTKKKY